MVEGELDQSMCFGFIGRAETGLRVKLGPTMRPVPVEIDSARGIFIKLAVPIIVDALCILRINRTALPWQDRPCEESAGRWYLGGAWPFRL